MTSCNSVPLLLKLNLNLRFIEDAGRPLITEFKQEHAHKIFEMEITHHFILFVDKAHTDFNAMLKTVSCPLCSDGMYVIMHRDNQPTKCFGTLM